MVFKLEPLTEENIFKILKQSLIHPEGLSSYKVNIEDNTLLKLANTVNGDVRTALNALEVAVITTEMDNDGVINITDEIIAESMIEKKAIFDKFLHYPKI